MKTITNRANFGRREFLRGGLLASTMLAAGGWRSLAQAGLAKPAKAPGAGLKLGLTSYTLRKYNLDQVITLTQEAGVKYISLKDVHLPLKSTPVERQTARQKLAAAGLTLMGGGVIYMKNNEEEIRSYFDYARDAGMPTIICSPDPDALDTVEKFAAEYQIRIAIHNHGPGDKKYPSPRDVHKLVKNRSPLMGVCMDVGHTVRIGEDPVEAIQTCSDRLYDFHIKDVTAANEKGGATEVGRGIIDIVAVLQALVKAKYVYHLALEYEDKGEAPVPGMSESFGYIRGVLATMG